jgi:methionine--tRNA ligase beta chain
MDKISFEDFQKVEIRIGTVTKAEVPEWSHWVIKLLVDFGSEIGERVIFAGMMKFFKPEDFEGKQFPFVVNIEPKKIGPEGDFSQGMILAADLIEEGGDPEEGRPILFNLQEKVSNGTKVR